MAGNHHTHVQAGDQVERGARFKKAGAAIEFWEDHAKAVFPQGVGRNKDALVGTIKDQ